MTKKFITNPWTGAMVWGLAGGLLMLISSRLPFDQTWKKELPMVISFIACLTGFYYSVRVRQEARKFAIIFSASVLAWMLMFVVPHIFLAIAQGGYTSWWIIPFFQTLGLGVIFCALLTWATMRLRRHTLTLGTN